MKQHEQISAPDFPYAPVAELNLSLIHISIQQYCESHSYGVVREFVGHGIGKNMHEDPQVPNYGKRGYGPLMKRGLCIAIEPMITLGAVSYTHLFKLEPG